MLRRISSLVNSNSDGVSGKHIITSPTMQPHNVEGSQRRPSILASAFENAWKRGDLMEKLSKSQENLHSWEGTKTELKITSSQEGKNVPISNITHQPLKRNSSNWSLTNKNSQSTRKSQQFLRSTPSRQFTTSYLLPIKEDLPPPSTPPPPPPFTPPSPPPSSTPPLSRSSKTTSPSSLPEANSPSAAPRYFPPATSRPPPPVTRPPPRPSPVRRDPPTSLLPRPSSTIRPSPLTISSPPLPSPSTLSLSPTTSPSSSKPCPSSSSTSPTPPIPPRPFPPNYLFHPRSSLAFKMSIENTHTAKHSFIHSKANQAPSLPRTASLA